MRLSSRLEVLVPALWAGWMLCVGTLATPAPFATLAVADAGRVVSRMLAQEAYTALVLGIVMLLLERAKSRRQAAAGQGSQFSVNMALCLGTLFCTVAGYFAVQPMMAAARAGQGSLSFGQLHAISAGFFVVKGALVLVLAWRSAAVFRPPAS